MTINTTTTMNLELFIHFEIDFSVDQNVLKGFEGITWSYMKSFFIFSSFPEAFLAFSK